MPEAQDKPAKQARVRGSRRVNLSPRGPGEAVNGRRSLVLDPQVRDEVIGGIVAGMAYEQACVAAGIDQQTFYNWLKRAREDQKAGKTDSPHLGFFEELNRASTKGERRLATLWAGHAKEDWRAAQGLLSQSPRFRERWSQRSALELSGPGGGPIQLGWPEQRTGELVLEASAAAELEPGDGG